MNDERILVVEDDFLTALEIARILREAGSEIVGPVGSFEDALSLATAAVIDAAVLDINLDGHRVYDVADVLCLRRIPFLFVTGHRLESLPEEFLNICIMAKPLVPGALVGAVRKLVTE
jgi:DNA-binding response OmpR family regulator